MAARSLDGVRVVFADMDETFLRSDKGLVARNMALLDRFAERDIAFVPCTGRALHTIPAEVLGHPSVRHVIPVNGSCVYELPDGRMVMDATVGKARALALYEALRELPITFDVFADGDVFTERWRWRIIDELDVPEAHREFMRRARTPTDLTTPRIIAGSRVVERVGAY